MGKRNGLYSSWNSPIGWLLLIVLASLINPGEQVEAAAYKDMKGHWAERAVTSLSEQGIIKGDSDGRFYPEQPVSRAELTAMLIRSLGPGEENPPTVPVFKDVAAAQWYFPLVQEAAARRLVTGEQGKTFYPEKRVTRQEAAVIIARALEPQLDKLVFQPNLLKFRDKARIEPWAVRGIYLANSKGILKGNAKKQIQPQALTTRAELAVMLSNFLNCYRQINIPVLTYHHLVPGSFEESSTTIIGERAFSAQMQLLVEQGYHTINTQQLYDFLRDGTPLPNKPVLITFDDGYQSNYELAYPILKRLGLKATINIVVGSTPGEVGGISESMPLLNLKHLTWEEMQEMVLSGLVEIQSHTYNSHRYLLNRSGKLSPALTTVQYFRTDQPPEKFEQYNQRVYGDLLKAKEIIEQKLGTKVTTLAYPYGAFDFYTEREAKEAGYLMTLTSQPGLVHGGDLPYQLKRINIGSNDSLVDFQAKLMGVK